MIGLPGQGMHLGIDPLSALFLCMLVPQIVASAVASEWKSGAFWALVLGMVLTLLAADAFALTLGFGLMGAASWLLVLRGTVPGARQPAGLYAGIVLFSAACLVPAVFLPAGNIAFALLLLGAGAMAGLAPLHAWAPRAQPVPSAGVAALLSGGVLKIALYVIIRYGFIVYGNAIAPWWGVALMAAGAASVTIGSLRAMLEVELKTVLACSTVAYAGLIAIGLGLALEARALDDPALAVLALEAALSCAVAHALFKPLLHLGTGAVQEGTGTTSLDWLGGLARGMPRLGILMLIGVIGMTALPLGPGFAPQFLLLHAVIAAAASGGIQAGIGFSALLAILALSAGLTLAAGIRIFGIGFLGRPRTLRAAAAEEAEKPVLLGMALLAAFCLPVALTPGLLLRALQPVLQLLVPNALPQPLSYAPLPLALLLLLPAGLTFLLLRRFGARGEREVPAWNGGFGKPPVWLPFGDPITQPSATGFAEPVRRALGAASLGRADADPGEKYLLRPLARLNLLFVSWAQRIGRATLRRNLAILLATLVLFLLALGLGQGG
jgi:hydrogenase-4 component B